MEKIIAYSFIKLARQQLESFLTQIEQFPQVKHFSIVTGEFDGILEIEVDSMQELSEFYIKVDKLDGIDATNTHIEIKKYTFNH